MLLIDNRIVDYKSDSIFNWREKGYIMSAQAILGGTLP